MKKIFKLLAIVAVTLLFAGCCTTCNQPAPAATACKSGNCAVAKEVKGPNCKSGKCAMKKKACMCKQGEACQCPAGKCQCKAPMTKKSCAKCEMKKEKMSCGAGKCGQSKCGGSK